MWKKATEGVNHKLLWPALILLVVLTTISVLIPEQFVSALMVVQKTSISYLGGTASVVSLLCVLTVLAIYISPLGKVKLGGKDAKPIMNKWNWFAIALCTTIATGCVYWGIVQPILHVNEPPIMWAVEPNSPPGHCQDHVHHFPAVDRSALRYLRPACHYLCLCLLQHEAALRYRVYSGARAG